MHVNDSMQLRKRADLFLASFMPRVQTKCAEPWCVQHEIITEFAFNSLLSVFFFFFFFFLYTEKLIFLWLLFSLQPTARIRLQSNSQIAIFNVTVSKHASKWFPFSRTLVAAHSMYEIATWQNLWIFDKRLYPDVIKWVVSYRCLCPSWDSYYPKSVSRWMMRTKGRIHGPIRS